MALKSASTTCFLLLLLLLAAFIASSTANPLRAHRYILEERLDGCPCKVQWGGYARTLSHVSVEIVTVRDYNLWVGKGRPYRRAKSVRYNHGFCGSLSMLAGGDHVMLVDTDHDGVDAGIFGVDRDKCKPTSIFDFNEKRDDNECKSTKKDASALRPAPGKAPGIQVPVSQRIVNGVLVKEEEIGAFNVLIKHFSNNTHRPMSGCSGSLIAPRWVMTAAHCHVSAGDEVVVGKYKGNPGETIAIEKPYKHPLFKQLKVADMHDVQLLKLKRKATRAQDHILAVNTDCKRPVPCRYALVSGYGQAVEGDVTHPACADHQLRATIVHIIENKKCHELFLDAHDFAPEKYLDLFPHICTTHEMCGGDTCLGDSGAPLVVVDRDDDKLVQVGVASYHTGQCVQRGHPHVYAELAFYAPWIRHVTGGEAKMSPPYEKTRYQICPDKRLTDREHRELLKEHYGEIGIEPPHFVVEDEGPWGR